MAGTARPAGSPRLPTLPASWLQPRIRSAASRTALWRADCDYSQENGSGSGVDRIGLPGLGVKPSALGAASRQHEWVRRFLLRQAAPPFGLGHGGLGNSQPLVIEKRTELPAPFSFLFTNAPICFSSVKLRPLRSDQNLNSISDELVTAYFCTWTPVRRWRLRHPRRAGPRCPVGPAGLPSAGTAGESTPVRHGAVHGDAPASADPPWQVRTELLAPGAWLRPPARAIPSARSHRHPRPVFQPALAAALAVPPRIPMAD